MGDSARDQSAELLRRWQLAGDRQALEDLLGIEIEVLKQRLRRRGGDLGQPSISVSDVAQDVVMRVLQVDPAPHFETPSAMRGYLWTAAQRLLIEHFRRRKSADVPLDPTQTGQLDKALESTGGLQGVDDRDHAAALNVVLQLLEAEDQQVLELYYFRSVDTAGIATTLGISRDAAKTRVARARMSLAKKLVKWTAMIG
ncbi:MAG TPA: RNA polymerase sigma factor [Planctomycetota bacterium]|nr:RNA polymerase sigma factor [Planctomycetota bacterium]